MRIKERVNPRVATLRRPDDLDRTFAATRYPYRLYVANIVIAIWILAVAVRLIMIDQPYVDHWSWRQSDVAAIARNFFEHGFRFGYPQIDWAGGSGGYVGTEFPILPFLAAICYKFAGIHEWIGRSQSVIFFAISFPFFFLLVREIFGDTPAVWAAFFYAFAPLNVFAGRSFMPDVPSLSLAIIGLYFFLLWLRDRGMISFCLAAIAISLSILIKATSIVIAAPLAYIIVGRLCQTPGVSQNGAGGSRATWTGRSPDRASGSERVKRPIIYRAVVLFAAVAILPSVAWYWH
ncbi:MAG: glycosyltransferase family 39 protein, partial [Candidatus Udaeobacter sp.]